jgi:DNA polymerase-3 subunit epsilon
MLAFDTETTGVSTEHDHILTASLIHIVPGQPTMSSTEWINPGVPIPESSSKIHGIYDREIKEKGQDPAETLESICLVIAAVMGVDGTPLVGMNMVFDLTMLDRNCRRYGVKPLDERIEIVPVIDAMVLDKKVEPFRKGTGMRKLTSIAPLYGIPVGKAHASEDDALLAARVCWRIGKMYPAVGQLSALELHHYQMIWKKAQDKSFAAWLKGQQRDATGVDGQWPYRPVDPPRDEETALW